MAALPVHSSAKRLTSRAALFLDHAKTNAVAYKLGSLKSIESGLQNDNIPDLINKLIAENQDVWNPYINHSFPKNLANGSASLDGFRNYMIQDKLYLEEYLRARMRSASTAKQFEEVKAFLQHAASTAEYVQSANDTIVNQLGVDQKVIDATVNSDQLKASIKFYTGITNEVTPGPDPTTDDSWFDINVALIPCIVGYYTIANKIMKTPSTIKNTLYYPLWVEYNSGASSVTEYRKFLNEHYATYHTAGADAKWKKIFREACEHEKNFLDLGSNTPTPYKVVGDDGEYEIHHFASGGSLGVNTDKTGVVIESKTASVTPHTWKLTATQGGYTIQDTKDKGYLSVKANKISLTTAPDHCWINPVPSALETTYFQVMVVDKLQSCLSSQSTESDVKPVTCDSNDGLGPQMWSFKPKKSGN